MAENLKPISLQQSHAQTLREDSLRRLSRSPHPYHRQAFELPYGSERFSTNGTPLRSPLRSAQNTDDDEELTSPRSQSESYRESANSDSGTEADDEHFLKGLPAPKLRPHKGLRGQDGILSGTPSPLLSPGIFEEDSQKLGGYVRQRTIPPINLNEEDARKAVEKLRQKRRVEIVRRAAEAGILIFVTGILCLDSQVQQLLHFWKKGTANSFILPTSQANEVRTRLSIPDHLFSHCHLPSTITTKYPPVTPVEEAFFSSYSSIFRPSTNTLSSQYYNTRLFATLERKSSAISTKYYPWHIITS
jgi:hypothetical protein